MEIRDLAKEAVIISEDSTFRDALSLMMVKHTNSLLVVNEDGKLSGEIGVSDLLNAIIPEYLEPDKVLEELATEKGFATAVQDAEGKEVRDFMTVDIEPVYIDDSLLSIAGTAIAHGTQHIPVIDHDDRPIGVISRRGLKHILASYIGITE